MLAHTKSKRQRIDGQTQEREVQEKCQSYARMVRNLMVVLQDYILLTRGALTSLDLEGNDRRICIWLEDVWELR